MTDTSGIGASERMEITVGDRDLVMNSVCEGPATNCSTRTASERTIERNLPAMAGTRVFDRERDVRLASQAAAARAGG